MINLPVLFIIFNRREIALKSFERIKKIQPKQLYIAGDGPRSDHPNDEFLIESTRTSIISSIDWDCNVKTLFQESNLGCGKGVFTAINWFFSQEEYGVILEDDCIADLSFFRYSFELLEKFKNDQRIGMIAGTNPIKIKNYEYSIIYSKFKSCWGWATWRRAWENMDINLSWRNSIFNKSILSIVR